MSNKVYKIKNKEDFPQSVSCSVKAMTEADRLNWNINWKHATSTTEA